MKHFHGTDKSKTFFEGWYLKHQSKKQVVAFIPAVHIDQNGRSTASVQVITENASWFFPFSGEEFAAAENKFYVRIGQNLFTEQGIKICLRSKECIVEGKIRYKSCTGEHSSVFLAPHSDVMGPFRLVPFMECFHGVVSIAHKLEGRICVNGEWIDFSDGTGYVEKDWGISFPKSYLWTQCSWYDRGNCCVMLSVADIPFLGKNFKGCIAVIRHGGKEYRIATYKGARICKWTGEEAIVRQGRYLLRIKLIKEKHHKLSAPVMGNMSRVIHESPSCKVRYQFYRGKQELFDFIGRQAGFESSGMQDKKSNRSLLTNHKNVSIL